MFTLFSRKLSNLRKITTFNYDSAILLSLFKSLIASLLLRVIRRLKKLTLFALLSLIKIIKSRFQFKLLLKILFSISLSEKFENSFKSNSLNFKCYKNWKSNLFEKMTRESSKFTSLFDRLSLKFRSIFTILSLNYEFLTTSW